MGKHDYTLMDRARDELMSHVVRCGVLDAHPDDRQEWLEETMGFLDERYPQLGSLEMAQLELIGRNFIEPTIPHGRGKNAMTRDDAWTPESERDEADEGISELAQVAA